MSEEKKNDKNVGIQKAEIVKKLQNVSQRLKQLEVAFQQLTGQKTVYETLLKELEEKDKGKNEDKEKTDKPNEQKT